MDRNAIQQKVTDLVVETLEVEADAVSDDVRFDDLGADSFDLLELVTAMEDEFGLTMNDAALESIATVGDAIAAIENAQ